MYYTACEVYRWYIVSALALFVVQSLLIAGLLFERRRRRQAEIELRRNLAAMAHLFHTAKKDGSGIRMGLAIARSIVEAHSGRMAAENNSGGGATVSFSIPMSSGRES
jgi:hypothetical protein